MLDLVVAWLCSAVAEVFQAAANFFSNTFGYDIQKFNATFYFAYASYDVILKIGLSLTLLIAGYQIVVFFWRGAEKGPDPPVRTLLNTVLAVCAVYFGNYIFEAIMDFCKYPYDALEQIDSVKWGVNMDWWTLVVGQLQGGFAQVSIVFYLIMLLLICYNMIKLLLEIVERYVVAFCLIYLSPAAASTLASSATSGIYKKYFMMFVSQCILIFLNSWCLRMACSGLSLSANADNDMVIPFLLCYGFLRISTKMDSYLNQLGLNAAITGEGLGAEIIGAGASMLGMGAGKGGGIGGGGEGGNPILGAAKLGQRWLNRVDPLAAVGGLAKDTIAGAVKGGSEGYRSGTGMWKGAMEGAKNAKLNSDNMISNITGSQKGMETVSAISHKLFNTPQATFAPGYRDMLKEEAITGANYGAAEFEKNREQFDSGKITEEQYRKNEQALTEKYEPLNKKTDEDNIAAWSNNSHLAHDAFSYVQKVDSAAAAKAAAQSSGVVGDVNAPTSLPPASTNTALPEGKAIPLSDGKPIELPTANEGGSPSPAGDTTGATTTPTDATDNASSTALVVAPKVDPPATTSKTDPPATVNPKEKAASQQKQNNQKDEPTTITENARVAAIAKGLGVGKQSKEAAEFIQAGFGMDGVYGEDFVIDKDGMHNQYCTRDGYRHKMDVVNQSQYSSLSTQDREGYEKFHTDDGHRYYMKLTKAKIDPQAASLGEGGLNIQKEINGEVYNMHFVSKAEHKKMDKTHGQHYDSATMNGETVRVRVTKESKAPDGSQEPQNAPKSDAKPQ